MPWRYALTYVLLFRNTVREPFDEFILANNRFRRDCEPQDRIFSVSTLVLARRGSDGCGTQRQTKFSGLKSSARNGDSARVAGAAAVSRPHDHDREESTWHASTSTVKLRKLTSIRRRRSCGRFASRSASPEPSTAAASRSAAHARFISTVRRCARA